MRLFDKDEAYRILTASELKQKDIAFMRIFLERFGDFKFSNDESKAVSDFSKQQKVDFPNWFYDYRTTITDIIEHGYAEVQFESFSESFDSYAPIDATLEKRWFALDVPGMPSDQQLRKIMESDESIHVFPIATQVDDPSHKLSVNFANSTDSKVYYLNLESLMEASDDGEPISTVVFPVFSSPQEMMSKIVRIRRPTR